MQEYIKIGVGVATGIICSVFVSRLLSYLFSRVMAGIDEKFLNIEKNFADNEKQHVEFYQRIGCTEKKIGIQTTKCDERHKESK